MAGSGGLEEEKALSCRFLVAWGKPPASPVSLAVKKIVKKWDDVVGYLGSLYFIVGYLGSLYFIVGYLGLGLKIGFFTGLLMAIDRFSIILIKC